MDDPFITLGELALSVAILVGPLLLGGAITQWFLLRRAGVRTGPLIGIRRAGVRTGPLIGIVGVAALLTLLLAWGLVYVVPPGVGLAGSLIIQGLLAAVVVTVIVGVLAKRFRPAA